MALTFPSSPTNGQVYTDTVTGNRYIYDSSKQLWKFAANNVGMSVSSTPPGNVASGSMWYNREIGRMFVYYDDGDSKQWVEAVPAGAVDTNTIASYVNPVFASMNGAYTTANAGFGKANTALQNTSGTFAGSLNTTGTVTANGYVYITALDGIGNEGGEIQLSGAGNYAGWSLDAYQNNHRTFVRTGSTLANVTYFHALGGSVRMGINKNDPLYTLDVNGTLSTSSRGITASSMPSGSVLQVATVTKTDVFSTGSSSFVDVTGLSVSITPTSSTSKVLVLLSICLGHDSSGGDTYVQLLSGSNIIGAGSGSTIGIASASYSYQTFYSSLSYLDSPATSSPITYKAQVRIGGGTTAYVNRRGVDTLGGSSSITVMEIAV